MAINLKHPPLLEWHFDESCPGVLRIDPIEKNYANGATRDDGLCFFSDDDAILQLTMLISKLHQRRYEKNPTLCSECKTPIPYAVTKRDPEWTCPKCSTPNMGQ
jgi:hypothetical protein